MYWDIYEFTGNIPLIGVRCRGRIRKYSLQENLVILVENATDKKNCVRFALPHESDSKHVCDFIKKFFGPVTISLALVNIKNPVLSKLKINEPSRYRIP